VKIGDYGLSRRISASMGGEMTRKVGTPYYMAPEIKNGNYGTSIDVYACGVILFEMLTGHPPFEGQSTEEVLIKHQTDNPDCSKLPPGFGPVLQKALEKDPAKRFANLREFARAVEVLPVSKSSDSVVQNIAGSAAVEPGANPVVPPRANPVGGNRPDKRYMSGPIPQSYRERLTEFCGSAAMIPVLAGLCTAPWALVPAAGQWTLLGRIFLLSCAFGWGVLTFSRFGKVEPKTNWGRRLRLLLAGMGVGCLAFYLDGWVIASGTSPRETSRDLVVGTWARLGPDVLAVGAGYMFYFGLAAAVSPWWKWTKRERKERFRVWAVMQAGIGAAVPLFLWPAGTAYALAIAPPIIAAIAVQLASPWSPPPPPPRPVARVVAPSKAKRQRCAV
jgi:hypothetical protein